MSGPDSNFNFLKKHIDSKVKVTQNNSSTIIVSKRRTKINEYVLWFLIFAFISFFWIPIIDLIDEYPIYKNILGFAILTPLWLISANIIIWIVAGSEKIIIEKEKIYFIKRNLLFPSTKSVNRDKNLNLVVIPNCTPNLTGFSGCILITTEDRFFAFGSSMSSKLAKEIVDNVICKA